MRRPSTETRISLYFWQAPAAKTNRSPCESRDDDSEMRLVQTTIKNNRA
jgi:hypothetical protein